MFKKTLTAVTLSTATALAALAAQVKTIATTIAIATVLAVTLNGCLSDQKQQIAKCELEALKFYPDSDHPYYSHDFERSHYVSKCMAAAGYEYVVTGKRCDFNPTESNAYCYRPMDPVNRAAFLLEIGENK